MNQLELMIELYKRLVIIQIDLWVLLVSIIIFITALIIDNTPLAILAFNISLLAWLICIKFLKMGDLPGQ